MNALGVAVLVIAVALNVACQAEYMTMTQGILFSALERQVVKEGKPLQGANAVRERLFAQDCFADSGSAISDDNGLFGI